LGAHIVLIMGLANLFADGFSMATGSYLSSKSEQEYFDRERAREAWEVDHYPEGEKAELLALYQAQGYSETDARTMVDIKSKDKKRWVDSMMVEELGMLKDEKKPIYSAIATFIAFAISGAVPLLVYLIGLLTPIDPKTAFIVSFLLSGVALFGLGAAKVLVTRLNPFRSGIEMLVVGGLAALVAYLVGSLLKGIGGG
jgi:VIT1/CCC1 family predicted Fe2+/Mn2+ transporter